MYRGRVVLDLVLARPGFFRESAQEKCVGLVCPDGVGRNGVGVVPVKRCGFHVAGAIKHSRFTRHTAAHLLKTRLVLCTVRKQRERVARSNGVLP